MRPIAALCDQRQRSGCQLCWVASPNADFCVAVTAPTPSTDIESQLKYCTDGNPRDPMLNHDDWEIPGDQKWKDGLDGLRYSSFCVMSLFLLQEMVRIISQGHFFFWPGRFWTGFWNVVDFLLVYLPVRTTSTPFHVFYPTCPTENDPHKSSGPCKFARCCCDGGIVLYVCVLL